MPAIVLNVTDTVSPKPVSTTASSEDQIKDHATSAGIAGAVIFAVVSCSKGLFSKNPFNKKPYTE